MKTTLAMKAILIVLIVASFLLLAGCGSSGGEKAAQTNYKQGIKELQLNFLENAPPKEIYPESSFKVILEVDNQAAYDVTDSNIKIVGLDEKYFTLSETRTTIDLLSGRSLQFPEGERTYLPFDGFSGQLFENAEQYKANFFLVADYNSQMDFSDSLCLAPNFYEVYDASCEKESKKTYSGQGAPLVLSQLEIITFPSDQGAELELRATLSNRGKGRIQSIYLGRVQLGGKELECSINGKEGQKKIELGKEQQEVLVICRTDINGNSAYTTTLAMNFLFSYELIQQKSLTLINPGVKS